VYPDAHIIADTVRLEPKPWLRSFWSEAGDSVEARLSALVSDPPDRADLPWPGLEGKLPPTTHLLLDSLGSGRGHVLVASLITGITDEERHAWRAWNAWVSDRLAFRLREQMGMAYGIGSHLRWLGQGRALWIASASTRQQNLEAMAAGLLEGPRLMELYPPSDEDLQKSVSGAYGFGLLRRATRMKRGLFAGLSLLKGRPTDWDSEQMERMGRCEPQDARRIGLGAASMNPPTLVVIVQ
jgi:hypothetical protein